MKEAQEENQSAKNEKESLQKAGVMAGVISCLRRGEISYIITKRRIL
jgi:hypothetical protein